MRIPINCDLFINDCILDPLDWINPITFTNPNINVVHSYGIHPKTNAPKPFFTRLARHLFTLNNSNLSAAFGPITILSEKVPSTPNFCDFISEYRNLSADPPILISSSPTDLAQMDKLSFENTTVIWQNLNNTTPEYINNFCRKILPRSENNFFTINGKCLEYKFANQISPLLRDKLILDKMLLGTDSPHYMANYYNDKYSQPLHIAKITLELHQHMIKSSDFSHFTLADTNDYFTSKSFSHFPRDIFYKSNTHSNQTQIRKILTPTLDEYRHLIRFVSQNTKETCPDIIKSSSSKRPLTVDIGLSPLKEISKPHSPNGLETFLNPTYTSSPTDHILPQNITNIPSELTPSPQAKRFCFEPFKELQIQGQSSKTSTTSQNDTILKNNNNSKENIPFSRQDLIIKCAYDLSYPGHQNS
ncbi:hypothetical protein V6O07_05065, partial [Arthrospira platensis SPKY2]